MGYNYEKGFDLQIDTTPYFSLPYQFMEQGVDNEQVKLVTGKVKLNDIDCIFP